jgi:pyruvate kinase
MSRPPGTDAEALAYAAVGLTAAHTAIGAIGCYTRTGRTARILSSLRPPVPVIALSPDPEVVTRLALAYGVVPRTSAVLDGSDRIGQLGVMLGESQLVADGTTVVLVRSTTTPGAAPDLLAVQRVVSQAAPERP